MNNPQNYAIKSIPSAKDILHDFQWYIILIAIILTSIGLLIDILQQLSAFMWIVKEVEENHLDYIVRNQYAVLLNIFVISSFIYLIIRLLKKRISIVKSTLIYATIICISTAIPYLWIIQKQEAVVGYLSRDLILFTITVFVVSTCTFGKYVYHVAIFAMIMCLIVALFSGNIFLQENIPMFLFMVAGFSFCLWKKDTLLHKIVTKQNEEKLKIKELSLFKENMNSMLFHDIKVPLNSIITLANSYSRLSNIKQIRNQAERVNRMLGNMIDIASYTETKIETKSTVFKVSELLIKVTQEAQFSAIDKEVRINHTYGMHDFNLSGDRDLIERAIINVVENAIKYSPKKSTINIIALNENDGISIRIIDEGSGIKEEEKDKIFNLFYSSGTPEEGKKSSGIGLAFCKMASEIHGGSLQVKTPDKGGSEFIFFLPCSRSEINHSIIQGNTEIQRFSEDVLNKFKPLLPQLNKLKYFHTSDIYTLLNTSDLDGNDSQYKELEELRSMALSCNYDKYTTLLNHLS